MAVIGWDAEGNPINGDRVIGWDADGRPVRRADADKPQPTPASRTVPQPRMDVAPPPPARGLQGVRDAVTGAGRRDPKVSEFTRVDLDRNPETGISGALARVGEFFDMTPAQVLALREAGSGYDALGDARTWGVELGYFLDPNERSRAEIIRRQVPSAEFRRDAQNNLQVRASPEHPWRYINRPGLSAQDIITPASEMVKAIPAAIASATPQGVLARLGVAGATSAATTAASQTSAVPFGGRGPQTGDVVMSGIGGAGGQALGEVGHGAAQAVLNWTGRGAVARELAGREAAAAADRSAIEAVTTDPAIRAYAAADEFGVPLTRGQASGNARRRQNEDDMLRGGSTEAAQSVMGRFADRQAAAIRDAGRRIATRGADPIGETIEDAGTALQASLASRRAALEADVDKAYDAAFAAAKAETVPASDELAARVAALVDENFLDAPAATRVIDRLQQLISSGRANFATVERARQALNGIIQDARDARNNALATAASMIKTELDDWTQGAMTTPAARETFNASRQIFGELKQLYGQQGARDAGGRAVENAIELERTGTQIAESILGAGNRPPAQALAAVNRIKKIATETRRDGRLAARPGATAGAKGFESGQVPEEMQALREAVFHKVLAPLDRRAEGGLVPAQTVATNLRQALDGPNKAIMAELFTEPELQAMRRYLEVVERIIPPTGVNTSGTAPAIARMIQGYTGQMFKTIFGVVQYPVEQITSRAAADHAISRQMIFLPQRSFAAHGVAATEAATDSDD